MDTAKSPHSSKVAPLGAERRTFPVSTEAQACAARDRSLVRRFVRGDEEAFSEIMGHYRPRLFGLALGLLKDPCDAEEIVQDAFVRAHRHLGAFRGDSSLATWLHRITLNLARNRYWHLFRRRRQDTISLDNEVGEDGTTTFADMLADPGRDPAGAVDQTEFAELVEEAMERIEPSYREVLVLRNVRHFSYEQIAEQLGLNVGTVKSRISRARERLRAELNRTCPGFAESPTSYLPPARPTVGILAPA